jgi:hypothetical protein
LSDEFEDLPPRLNRPEPDDTSEAFRAMDGRAGLVVLDPPILCARDRAVAELGFSLSSSVLVGDSVLSGDIRASASDGITDNLFPVRIDVPGLFTLDSGRRILGACSRLIVTDGMEDLVVSLLSEVSADTLTDIGVCKSLWGALLGLLLIGGDLARGGEIPEAFGLSLLGRAGELLAVGVTATSFCFDLSGAVGVLISGCLVLAAGLPGMGVVGIVVLARVRTDRIWAIVGGFGEVVCACEDFVGVATTLFCGSWKSSSSKLKTALAFAAFTVLFLGDSTGWSSFFSSLAVTSSI